MATTNGSSAMSAAQHNNPIAHAPAASATDAHSILGPPSGMLKTNPYDSLNFTNFDYPESVKDQTLFVETTITGFILESIDWYTTLALPWAQTDQMSVTWNEWRFNRPLADRVPHEGVSRLITSSKEEHKSHIVRRGLAFVLEADYANTPVGIEQFKMNVESISQAVLETQNHDTVASLLSCKDYEKLWEQRFGQLQVTWTQILDSEVEMFGSVCLPEGDKHLEIVIELHKRMMGKQNVSPDLLILWPGAEIYLPMTSPERTQYWKAGPAGPAKLVAGPKAMAVYRGMPVVTTRDFEVYDTGPKVELLTRPTQISERYEMRFDCRHETAFDFTTRTRSVVIYDANRNNWRTIGFLEAFKHGGVFDKRTGTWSKKLHTLCDRYNSRRQKPFNSGKSSDEEVEDADGGRGTSNHDPTFFLTTPDNEGKWMPMRYFGQMEAHHATATDMQRVGETLAAKMPRSVSEGWSDMIRLIEDIEGQGYDHDFFLALIAENTRESVSDTGAFVGELTPNDVAKHWGIIAKQREWKPNAYGGLRLPTTAQRVNYPAGYANMPGLLTLAAEARNGDSPWRDVGLRAHNAVRTLQSMLDIVRTHLPLSAVIDVAGRAPWFHRADALTTMFSHIVSVNRDPLFMLSLPTVGAEGLADQGSLQRQSGDTAGAASTMESGGVAWFALPGTVRDIGRGNVLSSTDAEALAQAVRDNNAGGAGVTSVSSTTVSAAGGGANIVYWSPTMNDSVTVSQAAFNSAVRYSPELRAFGALPGGDSDLAQRTRQAYVNIMRRLPRASAAATSRRKLIDFVYNMGASRDRAVRARMWRTLMGLNVGLDDSALPGAVDTLALGPDATDAEVDASVQFSTRLSSSAPGTDAEWEAMAPLEREWAPIVGDAADASATHLVFQEVAADVQTVLDEEADLIAGGEPAGNYTNPLDPAGGAVSTGALDAALARIAAAIARQNVGGGSEADATTEAAARARVLRARGAGSGTVPVSDSAADVAGARYYRTPLTVSLGLINSMSEMFAGRGGVAKPLVAPSDPATVHTQPFTTTPDVGELPGDVLRRRQFGPIATAIESPKYASLSEIMRDPALRQFDDTPFVERHKIAAAQGTALDALMAETIPSAKAIADQDEFSDDEEDDDDAVKFFSSASEALPMGSVSSAKRARFSGSAALIGAHNVREVGAAAQVAHQGDYTRARTGAFAKRWADANHISDPVVRACTHAMLATNCEFEYTWTNMIENDVLVPADIYLWRPNIVFEMASGIMMKGGLETGANLQGGGNAARSHDGVSKIIYFNFTFRSKAVVWKEKNVTIIENIKFMRYGGGLSGQFVENMNDLKREDADRPSIISTLIPMNEVEAPRLMDFSGRLRIPQSNPSLDFPDPIHYSSAEYYDGILYKLSADASRADPRYEDYFDRINRRMFAALQGHQYKFGKSGKSQFIAPQGHLKRGMCYPGAAPVYNGMTKTFREVDLESLQFEC